MSLPDDLQKLADLRRRGTLSAEEFELAKRKLLADPVSPGAAFASARSVRKASATRIAGWPLWAVATGPDAARGERRGHAKGIVAVGDVATGVLAIGGVARGIFALGGVAIGVVSAGGMAIGLALALGGGAIGGTAVGGGAIGNIAIGGGAIGRYALGGGAVGQYVLAPYRCDPEAVELFMHGAAKLPLIGPDLARQTANTEQLCRSGLRRR